MGQVTALAWALCVDPGLFTAGPELLAAAKEAFTLADREEAVLLQRLVRPAVDLWREKVCQRLHAV
jgi:hypothetical protein